MVDPISTAIVTTATTAGKTLAEKGTEEIVKKTSKIYELLCGVYSPQNQEIVISCPENIQKYSIAFETKHGVIPKKIKFQEGRPIRVNLRPIRSFTDLSSAITLLPDGFELNTQKMSEDDLFLLDIEYRITTPNFLEALVEKNRAKELPKDRENEYWMHAELKHPKVLKTKYGRLDLRDVDFTVDVGISEDINMVIPSSFKNELSSAKALLAEKNPHKKWGLGLQHVHAKKARGKGKDLVKSLGNLQNMFFSSKFCKYIDVQKDFHYSECYRGSNYYDNVPIPTWPKSMKVISRTDLGLENFAAEGVVVYKRENFLEEVAKILGIKLAE